MVNIKKSTQNFLKEKIENKEISIFLFRKLKEKEESDKVNDYLFSPSKGIIFRRQDNREFEIVEDSYLVRVNCRTKELENGTVVGKQVCPDCESFIGPTPIGLQSSTLSSLAIDEIFGSRLNNDAKLLAFTDNVQDASHKAGYFSSRNYNFTFRTALQMMIQSFSRPLRLIEAKKELVLYLENNIYEFSDKNKNFNAIYIDST
ncbi:MAG: hypothetical protein IPL26_12630 [Leptospiraceae bacterium]|nr:hypothetical protein [Leptospiraceae bacterium]